MRIPRALLLIIGLVALALGLLFIGQGLGIILWPASSFMLQEREWAVRGALLALAGAVAIWRARR
ncbi:hypothetical protein ACFOKI_01795 [Sphingomonas qilianensis]|uniref:Uncharacterized protein n=1 Tax=Sphingomonas qilianensis TaxID=1736690 RepID=A0ABU9XS58_9SPHN